MAMASGDVAFARCHRCGNEASPARRIRACTRCRSVGYCSRACQRADWTSRGGHKARCRPRPVAAAEAEESVATDGGDVARLEVKRGVVGGEEVWEDAGPIHLLEKAHATMQPDNQMGGDGNDRAAPPSSNPSTRPDLRKELPASAKRILGPEPSDRYRYRHSPDGVDENLLVFFHGSGDSHLPYDALGRRMELPQTATLSLSASLSLNLPSRGKGSKSRSTFVELPFGLGATWFEEMDCSTGEAWPRDHPRRLQSLTRAADSLEPLIRSLTGTNAEGGDDAWIPERVFLFGFSAGACLAMELCRAWRDARRMSLGGAICVAGGVTGEGTPPDAKLAGTPTDVLIVAGSQDQVYPESAAVSSQLSYDVSKVQVHVQKGKGRSMIGSEDEMRVVMEFLSKRLVRRMVSMGSSMGRRAT
ncbi:hypothetical protein ACHAWF_014898 [Thalassiosira exigua]